MNLLEAVKSGKKFRRGGWSWIHPKSNGALLYQDAFPITPTLDWFTAEDWEIEEPSITITRAQFYEAWNWIWLNNDGKPNQSR